MNQLYLQIITGRHDGCRVKISWCSPNQGASDIVLVQLLSCFDPEEQVDSATIPARDVVQWINDRRDW
jgi:hypothetical protein